MKRNDNTKTNIRVRDKIKLVIGIDSTIDNVISFQYVIAILSEKTNEIYS